jgi:hypothetical protein
MPITVHAYTSLENEEVRASLSDCTTPVLSLAMGMMP